MDEDFTIVNLFEFESSNSSSSDYDIGVGSRVVVGYHVRVQVPE